MANEKKYSAQEAAIAVLAKAQELLGKSELFKAEKLKKDGSIQAGIAAAGGGGNVPIDPGVSSSLGSAFGKAENPDEKEDAKLGEDVEHLCEDHMLENKDAERKEGHKIVKSEDCHKCMAKHGLSPEQIRAKMKKGESKHDRCVEHVKENSPDVKNPHAVCVAEGVRPAKWSKSELTDLYDVLEKVESMEKGVAQPSPSLQMSENMDKHGLSPEQIKAKMKKGEGQGSGIKEKPSNSADPRIKEEGIERDYKDFEEQPGKSKSSENDHRQEEQSPPEKNPAEEKEGNNPEQGSVPGNGLHKLMYFVGHMNAKKKMKKGICLG